MDILTFMQSQSYRMVWGDNDCTAIVAKWVNYLKGYDAVKIPMYKTEEQAQKIIDDAGGLIELYSLHLDAIAIETTLPAVNNVAIIEYKKGCLLGGIFGDLGYLYVRTNRGIRAIQPNMRHVNKIWSVI